MGDTRRFNIFADLIGERFADRQIHIADVASGKGYLQAALRQRGFANVTSWDRRPRNAKTRRGYRYGHFDYRNAPRDYGLVVGMHSDEATDQIICYATKHAVPFVVCPCCVLPSAAPFEDVGYAGWLRHLRGLAECGGGIVEQITLPMNGRNTVLIGRF